MKKKLFSFKLEEVSTHETARTLQIRDRNTEVQPVSSEFLLFTTLRFLSFALISGAWEKHEQEKVSKGYLNGLVIDERINGLRSSLVVCFIHLYTELGPTECIGENITNKPRKSFHYNPKITPCCFTSIVLQIVWRQHMFQDKLALPGRTLCHSGMSSKENWKLLNFKLTKQPFSCKKIRRVRYKSLSWFSCGSSILVELEFGVWKEDSVGPACTFL